MTRSRGGESTDERTNQDLHRLLAPQRQPAAADLEQAGTAALQHPQPAADANAHLGHAADPARSTSHVGDLGLFSGAKQFQRQEGIYIHIRPRAMAGRSGSLLRLNLNYSLPGTFTLSREELEECA